MITIVRFNHLKILDLPIDMPRNEIESPYKLSSTRYSVPHFKRTEKSSIIHEVEYGSLWHYNTLTYTEPNEHQS